MRLSGRVPQICCLFGPSAAGGAYIPSFCDIVIMVEGNASMYLGSPRMAEMVIGETTTLEEMGGARMHATVSGCGDNLAVDDADAIDQARAYLTYLPPRWREDAAASTSPCRRPVRRSPPASCPPRSAQGYDMHDVIDGLVDAESLLRGEAAVRPRADRRASACSRAARSASWPTTRCSKGGVLFVDSADKAARFIWCATRSTSRWCSSPTCPAS